MSIRKPCVLVILDGFGYTDKKKYNAIMHANIPHIAQWLKQYPHAFLKASGIAVGLPAGYIGNSEVGHLTMGAGRRVEQPLTIINKALEDGSFFHNPGLVEKLKQLACNSASTSAQNSVYDNKTLHIMGLLSDAGVHSHEKHLYGFIKAAIQCGVKNIVIHAFLDGRDVAPRSAEIYLERLEQYLEKARLEHAAAQVHIILGSVMGRFYAMDRDNNAERTTQAYRVLTHNPRGENNKDQTRRWQDVLAQQYARGISDEYIEPTNLDPAGIIKPGDGIIFFNFRPDRARQLTQAFMHQDSACLEHQPTVPASFACSKTSPSILSFALPTARPLLARGFAGRARHSFMRRLGLSPECPSFPKALYKCLGENQRNDGCIEGFPLSFFITPVSYFYDTGVSSESNQITVLFQQEPIPDTLKEVISCAGLTIFSIAETEKYAHITYFFSGYHEAPFPGETYYLVPSLHVKSYAQYPRMSAAEITQAVLASLATAPRDFYLINYANADMVGHSGDFQATVKAVECLDAQLSQLYTEVVEKRNGMLWITADHGKAEDMFDEKTGQPRTAHTANLVPFIEISRDLITHAAESSLQSLPLQELADIAPHILSVMRLSVPDIMSKGEKK